MNPPLWTAEYKLTTDAAWSRTGIRSTYDDVWGDWYRWRLQHGIADYYAVQFFGPPGSLASVGKEPS